VIIPFTAAVLDALGRVIGNGFRESTGQPLLLEARPGASSIIGMLACAKAAPDGYTICMTNSDSLSYNPARFSYLPYNPEADFVPVINLGWTNGSLVANAKTPFNTYKEMIAYAKAKPGTLNYGTWGPASMPDLYLLWMRHQTGADIAAIAYKGGAPAYTAVISGEVDITYMGIGNALQQIKAGKVKPLVVLGNKRSSLMPNTPSLEEEGGDPALRSYFGAFAPAKTPKAIVDRLNAEFSKAIRTPRARELYRNYTIEFEDNTPEAYAAFLRADRENTAKVFKSIGIKPVPAPSS
jgi:tripartite-type tricarboxylate transporter receptor subunit TctC